MEVFDLSILCKFVRDVLFGSFLVDVCDHYDPSLDGWKRGDVQSRVWRCHRRKTNIALPWSRLWILHGQTFDLLRRRPRSRLCGERKNNDKNGARRPLIHT